MSYSLFDDQSAPTPADTEAAKLGALRIRELKAALQSLLSRIFTTTGGWQPAWISPDQLQPVPVAKLATDVAPVLQVPTGTVLPFAGTVLPANYLWCDGKSYSQATYPALFTALGGSGSPYGVGTGTFQVPDMRGRVPVGMDNLGSNGAANVVPAGTLNPSTTLGGKGGEATHLLTGQESGVAAHHHSIPTAGSGSGSFATSYIASGTTQGATNTNDTGPTNAAQAHNNVQPSLFVNYIIRV